MRADRSPANAPESALPNGQERTSGLALRLRALAALLPEGALLVLDRRALDALCATESRDPPVDDAGPDCTVAEAAVRLRLSANRVRALIGEGSLEAYRVAGRGHWHITPAALAAFRRTGSSHAVSPPDRPGRVNLGRWRGSAGKES